MLMLFGKWQLNLNTRTFVSKPVCTKHLVTVYSIVDSEKGRTLRLTEAVIVPSKTYAIRYARLCRKKPGVSSATVTKLNNVPMVTPNAYELGCK
jgi:hypothetical protein